MRAHTHTQESIITCVGQIDHSRCILGDQNGRILMLFVESEQKMDAERSTVSNLKLQIVGEVT